MIKEIKNKAIFDYDAQSDVLYVYTKGIKYKESMDLGDIIVDIGEKGVVKGIVILDASKKFKLDKYDLKHVKKLSVEVKITSDVIKLKITIGVIKRSKEVFTLGRVLTVLKKLVETT